MRAENLGELKEFLIDDILGVIRGLRRSALMDRFLLLLFAHPAWEIRSNASKLAAAVAVSRPKIFNLVDEWIDHSDYRVRYAAIETTYLLRHRNPELFERAILDHAADPESWVRGIVAECLSEWIVREDEAKLFQFQRQLLHFLDDEDMWPLEAMAYLFRTLHQKGNDVLKTWDVPLKGKLARVPERYTMERARFQQTLDQLEPSN